MSTRSSAFLIGTSSGLPAAILVYVQSSGSSQADRFFGVFGNGGERQADHVSLAPIRRISTHPNYRRILVGRVNLRRTGSFRSRRRWDRTAWILLL